MSERPSPQTNGKCYIVEECSPKNSDRVYSLLAYAGVLWLVGLLVDKNNSKMRFHINQGVLLTIVYVAVGMVVSLLGGLFTAIFWKVGSAISIMLNIVMWISYLIFVAIGLYNAWKGEERPLPFIGNLFTLIR